MGPTAAAGRLWCLSASDTIDWQPQNIPESIGSLYEGKSIKFRGQY